MHEKELILGLIEKDEPAFKWLVETYRNKIYNTILNILQDEEDAEDGAQEVFIQVYQSISSFKQQSSLSTWIYRISVMKALDKLRKRKTRQRIRKFLPWWMPDETKSGSGNFNHPGVTLENKQKAAVLFKAIDALPEKQKIAITLIKVQGMNYEEASAIMDQSIKAIESLISRAKQNLQKQLQNII
ncbi:MAG TPA: RNA polymerase sigma factor [Chitinophagaceae bacterium]|nr:RNA polymerase sigma factor [Chitinophagaceae bacterium]